MIEYQILLECLPHGANADDAWEALMYIPYKKEDGQIHEADVIKLKEQVATHVVFAKTPARVRVAWVELSRGKIGGKHIENPREVYFFDDFTFDTAREFLIVQLEAALKRVWEETPGP
jgi:hypothetical protein